MVCLGVSFNEALKNGESVLLAFKALARLRESSVIESADFEEALRLLETSKASVRLAEDNARRRKQGKVTQVFDILR